MRVVIVAVARRRARVVVRARERAATRSPTGCAPDRARRARGACPAWLQRADRARARRRRARRAASSARCRRGCGRSTVAGVVGLGFGGPQIALGLAVVVAVGRPGRGAGDARAPGAADRGGGARDARTGRVGAAIGRHGRDRDRRGRRRRRSARARHGAGRHARAPRRVARARRWRAWSSERAVVGVDASAGALAMCASVGGRSADALDGLATSLRDRLGGRGRGARAVVAGADVGAGRRRRAGRVHRVVGAGRSARAARAHRHRRSGARASSLGLGLEALGGWWMRSIVRSGSRA